MSFIRVVLGLSMLFTLQTLLMVSYDIAMTFVNKLTKRDYTWKSSRLFLNASGWSGSLFQMVLYFLGMYCIIQLLMGKF